MNANERFVERIKAAEMARRGVVYEDFKLPKIVLRRTKKDMREIETTKQRRIRKEVMIPPKFEEGMRKNGKEIAKAPRKLAIDKMENTNRVITGIHTKVPIIYYVVMAFGLLSAFWGTFPAASYPIYYSVVIGGIGVALVAFIGVLEVGYKKGKVKISGCGCAYGY